MPLALQGTQVGYMVVVALGGWLALTRRLQPSHVLIVIAFCVSVLFNAAQGVLADYGLQNSWLNTVWPRFQGGLFLAALTAPRWRIVAFAAPPAVTTWCLVAMRGTSSLTEKLVELTVFATVAFLAARKLRTDPLLGASMLVYAIPTILLSPVLVMLARRELWDVWLNTFQLVHVGRLGGLILAAVWLWRTAPRPSLQRELFPGYA